MPKKFTLPDKPCQLGSKFITSSAGEDAERKSYARFSIEGYMLSAKELDKILGLGAHDRLFTKGKGSDALEPAFGEDVNEFKLAHRYVDSTVTLSLDSETVTMPAAKIMGVVLQPQIGGLTWMGCDIEAPIDLADGIEDIGHYCGLKVSAHLAFGQKPVLDKRQKELPMNHDVDDDAEDADEKPKGRGNGKSQPAAH